MKFQVLNGSSRGLKPALVLMILTSLLTVSFSTTTAKISQAQLSFSTVAPRSQQLIARKPVRLPGSVKTAVFKRFAREFNVSTKKLRVVSFSQETWPDTCLGLAKPEQACGAMMVEGWRLLVSDGSLSRIYRTDRTGSYVDVEDISNLGSLPKAVADKVLAFAAKDLGLPVSQLKVAEGRSQVWDGCMGVAGPNQACTMIAMPGWQVIVTGPKQQYWVYHLTQSVEQIKRNPTTSGQGNVVPSFWSPAPSPAPTQEEILFQSVTSGGFAGQTYRTMLMRDGRLLRVDLQGESATSPKLIRRVSDQQMQAFIQTLQNQELGDFIGFSYLPTAGADYFTIALMTPDGNQGIQYADIIQDQTPPKLQKTIQAWDQLSRSDAP
ncbi:MAG TPA: hypothetical protein IGS53_10600 [Leptolyngbyaceae cyanobacterium M33_DOE_097]|uniref:Uncharacterized protein n=1 Tax=Oscillatoriales cyanobacterium SpSt-418 TaxID=2282169 RepID=A0A7C3KIP4_9CYAN|nr:hypothetical protein [Leptolyngbyaceae cyanobacterium M33_DOE_097]